MKLIENNPLNDTSNIKYVRHKDTKSDIFNGSFFDTSSLEIYQKQQETNVFKGINYIVSFIGIEWYFQDNNFTTRTFIALFVTSHL